MADRERIGTLESLRAAATSWRLGSVALQSFASGLPLGIVYKALPAWLKYAGFDVKTIGWISLAQAPWAFKFLWSPLMDRYVPPFLGRRRAWMAVAQVFLIAGIAVLAWIAGLDPLPIGAVAVAAVAIAFWSATQDIAIDGYAVEVLEKREHGMAVGARTAVYRAAFFIAGGLTITLAQGSAADGGAGAAGGGWGWPATFLGLALLYLPLLGVVIASPEPAVPAPAPTSLRAAVFEPMVGLFRTARALEIMAFVFLYKLSDNLATALQTPFLIEKGFSPKDVGIAVSTLGVAATIGGTFLGGLWTDRIGLGHALWIFGVMQAVSNLGFVAIDQLGVNRPVMYSAIAFDTITQGVATGAFFVLLLRLTQKRFSATQYALFSSIMALGRTVTGPPAGILVDAIGWTPFFVSTLLAAVPGMAMLHRFAPLGVREPRLDEEVSSSGPAAPLTRARVALHGLVGTSAGLAVGVSSSALLAALKAARGPGASFDLGAAVLALLSPETTGQWIRLCGPIAFGLVVGVVVMALSIARRGLAPR